MGLERELAVYNRERPGWILAGLAGQWAVIHAEEVLGIYISLEAALDAGYDRYGPDELFMARQIAEIDRPIHSSRRAIHANPSP